MLPTRVPSDHFGLGASPPNLTAPPLARYGRADLQVSPATLACMDLLGAVTLSALSFGTSAELRDDYRSHSWACLGGSLAAWLVASHSQRLYQQRTLLADRRALARTIATCAIALGAVLMPAFDRRSIGGISRFWLMAWTPGLTGWTVATRIFWRYWPRGGRCLSRPLVLAGAGSASQRVRATAERESGVRTRVAGCAPLPGFAGGSSFAWIEEAAPRGVIDRVLIAGFEEARDEIDASLARLMHLAVIITLMPDFQGPRRLVLRMVRIRVMPADNVFVRLLSAGQGLCRRMLDVCVAGVAVLVLLPAFLLAALAIKWDSPGPVFLRQRRVEFHGSTARAWRFNLKRHDLQDAEAACQMSRGDRRITRVGRSLRRASVDEVPQPYNVLAVDMSLVGPRPHAVQMTAAGRPLLHVLEEHASGHRIKPGVTGWAQITGWRGTLHTEEERRRIASDCYRIETWSLMLDGWTMLRTLLLPTLDGHAY